MDEQHIQKNGIKRALIIKPSSLGDIIHSLPFLHSIKKCIPGLEADWVVASPFAELLEGHPLLRKLWVINKDNWKKPARIFSTLSEFHSLSQKLRAEEYDIVFDLQGLLRSGLITKASGAAMRLGFKEAREGSPFFYTHKIEGGRKIHAVLRYLKMAEYIGCVPELDFPLPRMDNFISPYDEYAVIAPGARWSSKKWPAENFGALASMLPMRSIVVGSSSDIKICEEVQRTSKGQAISHAGRSGLRELVEIIRHARLMITNDSGPMHIAAALEVPVFAIFGPTDPGLTGPYGKGRKIVIRNKPDCAPCRNRECKDRRCIDLISPDKVAEEVRKTFPF